MFLKPVLAPSIHAKMGPGEENSGKLVTEVRRKAKEIATEIKADFIINDGPPGIGCSAIASVTGTNLVLLVIEPTLSGSPRCQPVWLSYPIV